MVAFAVMTTLARCFTVVVLVAQVSLAREVRLSFLNSKPELRNTIDMILTNGCTEQAAELLQRVVEHYYSTPFTFDYSSFPQSRDGFYSFKSMRELIAALPHRLCDTTHDWTFNCFDTAIALAGGEMRFGFQPDDNVGPFMVSVNTTNGEGITLTATARDAFAAMCEPTPVEAFQGVFPPSMRDAQVCLNAGLFCWHLLPRSTHEEDLEAAVIKSLRAGWKRQALSFPRNLEVVLCHKADLEAHTICTPHAGILFRRGKGYTYLEKAGGRGPFLRLELDNSADLLPWLSAGFDEREHRFAHLFATFNDSRIEKLDSDGANQPSRSGPGSASLASSTMLAVGLAQTEALKRLHAAAAVEVSQDVLPDGKGWAVPGRHECLFLSCSNGVVSGISVERNSDQPKMYRTWYSTNIYSLP
jgi:hypothetical protein